MTMQLDLSQYDTPAAAPQPVAADPEPQPELILAKTKHGRNICICSTDPIPPAIIDEAIKYVIPIFSRAEIHRLAGVDDDIIGQIIDFKMKFPGTTVKQFLPEQA